MSAAPTVTSLTPGVQLVPGGADLRVFAARASRVWAAFGDDIAATAELHPDAEPGWWVAHLPGARPGMPYSLHASGPEHPQPGDSFDPRAALIDPYARAIDSRGRAVIVDPHFDWGTDAPPRHAWADTVIYEAHVRGLTRTHPGVPPQLRGTYAGIAHPAIVEHLHRIGVTAIELLPVHAFVSEPALLARGLVNYWGYNTLGFFAPHHGYAATHEAGHVVAEFKAMVKALHAAGIEVILDVVYNHTAEQGSDGPALSWRGLDNRAYYRMDEYGRHVDVTGCGNTVDTRHPVVEQLVLDSLRYWTQEMHVDGFRFDLAVALARDVHHNYDPNHPFLTALREDPVLRQTKLISEPWDVGMGGWRTGQFPEPFAEWNDRFRDDVRTFWLTDLGAAQASHPGHGIRDLATRMAGSEDLFHGRGPLASINFIAAHDGFTTADLTAYSQKHNEANGEGNRDGASHNRSWNHGIEGDTDQDDVLALRRRTIRNLLGTLLLSAGVPMLNAGDEFGRSQGGNNNAYCQDNEIGWLGWDWSPWQVELVEHVAELARLRREHPTLRRTDFFTGSAADPGGLPDVSWHAADGSFLEEGQWHDPYLRTMTMLLGAAAPQADLLIVINGSPHESEIRLPHAPGCAAYTLLWDSAQAPIAAGSGPEHPVEQPVQVPPVSLQLWAAKSGPDATDPPATRQARNG